MFCFYELLLEATKESDLLFLEYATSKVIKNFLPQVSEKLIVSFVFVTKLQLTKHSTNESVVRLD